MISVTMTLGFSAAHFYAQPKWSAEKNKETFGKCFTEFGHGHDYKLEVEVPFEQKELLEVHLKQLIEILDHQHLNFVIEEFKTKIPTTENIAVYCREKLEAQGLKPISLKLFETPDLWVELKN